MSLKRHAFCQPLHLLGVVGLVCLWLLPAVVPPVASGAEAPFSFDSAPGRLPKDVVPADYDIAIVPDVGRHTFTGKESVTLQVRSATAHIVFNTLGLRLRDVRFDGVAVQNVAVDNDAQLTTVTLEAPAPVGTHQLTLSYDGVILTRPQGLFAQPYSNVDGSRSVMLSTQMEAPDARRMFPCWDEPAFRSTFQLTATVPAAWATISNMPIAKRQVHGRLATVTFERSPRMPTYLVDFTAGDLREITAEHAGTKFGVWAVRGHEQEGTTALASAQQILADYNDYFGYPFPLPKLDSIAIPGGYSGAMENWGAITYQSQLLLVSKASSLSDRQQVYSVQAHEMAHQWNGDLVTMGWWDDIWLNESFASWRAAKETDLRNPTWKWWEGQDEDKEGAMSSDAQPASHPIQQHVVDEQQAQSAFDPVITYSKGQAVLRMLENYMGADTFRDGVRRYIKARAFSNATTADLWQALSSASNQDVNAIAAGWTEQAGFPLVSVSSHCEPDGRRTITLSQRRFLLSPLTGDNAASAPPHWSVPLQVRSGTAATPRSVLLTRDDQRETAGSCSEPLSINSDAIGYFRVEYDAATLSTNTRSFASLPDGDRIALLDDQWALVEAGVAPLATYLALASGMGEDLDVRAWKQIADSLATIEYDERGTQGHGTFAAYARSVLKPVVDRLGWDSKPDETPAVQSLRRTVLRDLGIWGDQSVIGEAQKRFRAFVRDRGAINPDDQSMLLSIVGLYADAPTFEQLHDLARHSKDDSEQGRLYVALAGVRDPKLAAQSAQIALSKELPPQDVDLPLEMIAQLQEEQPKLAWDSFAENQERLLAPMGALAPVILTQYMPEMFWNSLPPDQLQAWLKAHVPADMNDNVERGMQAVRFKVSEKAALVPAVDAYLASRARSG
jgi:aminopeptidase N